MKLVATINAQSQHTIAILSIDNEDAELKDHPAYNKDVYKNAKFYVARNFNKDGLTFFYLAKGHDEAPAQIHVWYKNKNMWSSYGTNFQTAIDGAQRDGWLAAD